MQRRALGRVGARRERRPSSTPPAFALVAILIVAVAWAARLTPMGTVMTEAVCKVSARPWGSASARTGRTRGAGEQTDPEDIDIPSSLDPESELVQQLLSTERGRQTLQWLFDNNIPILIDPSEPARTGTAPRWSWVRATPTPRC